MSRCLADVRVSGGFLGSGRDMIGIKWIWIASSVDHGIEIVYTVSISSIRRNIGRHRNLVRIVCQIFVRLQLRDLRVRIDVLLQ
jgi:hypothetical protein